MTGHDGEPCPTPEKRAYDTKDAAAYALRNTPVIERGLIYRCNRRRCGKWHVTSQELTRNGRHGKAAGTLAGNARLHEMFKEIKGQES